MPGGATITQISLFPNPLHINSSCYGTSVVSIHAYGTQISMSAVQYNDDIET